MRTYRAAVFAAVGAITVALGAIASTAQVPGTVRDFGRPVAPMFEGWYKNADGTATVLVGFFNPNQEQTVDLPIGDLNRFSPGSEDRGQPTHFPPGRSWGVLAIQVPGDFDGDLSWTLTANNQPASIPVHLQAPYFVEPFRDAANGNEPPTIRFTQGGESFTGPPVGVAHTLSATVDPPLELSVWTSDAKPADELHAIPNPFFRPKALTLRWHRHRGPAEVEFADPVLAFEDSADQNPTTTATFSTPGEYWLRAEALDETGIGGGGFQCCWTSAIVRVTVSP
jgi:hypothetical protein